MNKTEKPIRHTAEFISSSAHYKEFPRLDGKEYAIMGRSNVGKSSFINHVLENHSLARVSRTPGKTILANIFKIDSQFYFIDLPGYGYAKISGKEKLRLSKLIDDYCSNNRNLAGVIWLIDIRHIGLEADIQAYEWLHSLDIPVFPVLTKGDKLSFSGRKQKADQYRKIFTGSSEALIYSTKEHASRKLFWDAFEQWYKTI